MEVNASLRDVRHISKDPFFYDPAQMRTATGEAPRLVTTDGGGNSSPPSPSSSSSSSIFSLFSVGQYYALIGHTLREGVSTASAKFLPPPPSERGTTTPTALSSGTRPVEVDSTVIFVPSGTPLSKDDVARVVTLRESLAAPSMVESWNMLFVCVRRATHTSTMGFSDPSVVQCSEDFMKRSRAWYYWGHGGGASCGKSTTKVTDMDVTSRQRELQAQTQRLGHGGSTGGAASVAATLKQRQLERDHHDPVREAVRFVLSERKETVSNLYTLPWTPTAGYIEVLRRQGRLPEQLDEAVAKVMGI